MIETAHTSSLLFNGLHCPECGKSFSAKILQTICTDCGSSLFADYRLYPGICDELMNTKFPGMWKYFSVLPVCQPKNIITLGEGLTPTICFTNLVHKNHRPIFWKDESGNPTGSFKARGISAALSKAKELDVTEVAIPTAGNAGGAMAAYAAKGNLKAHIFMPEDTPKVFKDECQLYGAELVLVKGNISDCGKLCDQISKEKGWFQISTLKEPYRLEGKKTMGYEIAEYFEYQLPDVLLYPTGGGTGLIGIWKAFDELERLGWISEKRPRMVAVQSDSCNGISEAFTKNLPDSEPKDTGFTIANGLRVPKPYASKIILEILRESKGTAISLNDAEIEAAVKEIARKEGFLPAPEGAALWSAYEKLCELDFIKPDEKVLLLNTGSGYKYLENITI